MSGILQHLKSKYSNVKIYKIIKKNIFKFCVFEVISKNNRKLYYLAMLDKNKNLFKFGNKESFKLIAKNEINKKIKKSIDYLNNLKKSERIKNINKYKTN